MKVFTPEGFKDYELIDTGGLEKLERFGRYVLRRPEPQAVWSKRQSAKVWEDKPCTFCAGGQPFRQMEATSFHARSVVREVPVQGNVAEIQAGIDGI